MWIKKQLDKKYRDQQAKRNAEIAATPNSFRAGNVGYLQADGNVWGGCHRKTIARTLGITRDIEDVNPYMDVGRANEIFLIGKLDSFNEDYDELVPEPGWELRLKIDDIEIVGHPDLGYKKAGQYIAGSELKASSSSNQLIDPFVTGIPKGTNILQSALYSHMSGVPFYLFNKAYAKPSSWQNKSNSFIPEVEIKVFTKDSKIYYDKIDEVNIDSGLGMQGILDYYKLCQELIDKKQLYRDPIEENNKYDHTKYCTECVLAKKANHEFDEWINLVKKHYGVK